MKEKAHIMDASDMSRALERMALEIIERNKGTEGVALLGIQRRGVPLAKRLAEDIERSSGVKIPIGTLDITFYRDDLSTLAVHPVLNGTDIPFEMTDRNIVLVDDVLYTGRTVRAAIEAIMDLGRPKSIQLAVLIDRGLHELPISADNVGKRIPTSKSEIVSVRIAPFEETDEVVLLQAEDGGR